jgi:hypothetical protein
MKLNNLLGILGAIGSLSAIAAGNVVCEVPVTGELVKIYGAVDNDEAASPAVMVLSQPNFENGNKTIAVLRRTSLAENDSDVTYTAKVDHRDEESSHEGELFAQTKIKYLKKVSVSLPKEELSTLEESTVHGKLILLKRNGDVESLSVDCEAL